MKPNSWYLEKLQIDARQRHAEKPIPVKVIKIKRAKPKKRKKVKRVKKYIKRLTKAQADREFKLKQERIKATAEKINKVIGMNDYPYWHKTTL